MSIAEKLTQITENQQAVYDAGYQVGESDGYDGGYSEGYDDGWLDGFEDGQEQGGGGGEDRYDEGYEDGQQAEYDRFWDAYQQNGNRTNYFNLFSQSCWDDTTFRPKYPIECKFVNAWDTSAASSIFNASRMTKITVPITVTGMIMSQTFYNNNKLVTISKLILNGVTEFSNTFGYCSALKNITIDGSIDVNISFGWSPLTTESVDNIIEHLKDLTGLTAQKLTLSSATGANLTQAQKDAITAKNWTLAY